MASKSKLKSILKTTIPLVIGLGLVYYMLFYRMQPEERTSMFNSIKSANYWWIGLSLFLGILSHASRAYRWKFMLNALGHKPKFWNSFYSVMIGYMMNLLVPRMGEVSRCVYFSKYEKISFEKTLGTVIAERIADAIILLSLITITMILQYKLLFGLIENTIIGTAIQNPIIAILILLGFILLAYIGVRIIKTSKNKFISKIRGFVLGLLEGVQSILKMKKKGAFILHTIFIWSMYVSMFMVCFYCLPGLEDVSINGKMAGFVVGGIAVATTNGGLGAYPAGIMAILALYGVDESLGGAFGWVAWSAQTLMLLLAGLLSILLISLYNKKNDAQ
jgi:uncharacterized protein (TIRG00374 family)